MAESESVCIAAWVRETYFKDMHLLHIAFYLLVTKNLTLFIDRNWIVQLLSAQIITGFTMRLTTSFIRILILMVKALSLPTFIVRGYVLLGFLCYEGKSESKGTFRKKKRAHLF